MIREGRPQEQENQVLAFHGKRRLEILIEILNDGTFFLRRTSVKA